MSRQMINSANTPSLLEPQKKVVDNNNFFLGEKRWQRQICIRFTFSGIPPERLLSRNCVQNDPEARTSEPCDLCRTDAKRPADDTGAGWNAAAATAVDDDVGALEIILGLFLFSPMRSEGFSFVFRSLRVELCLPDVVFE